MAWVLRLPRTMYYGTKGSEKHAGSLHQVRGYMLKSESRYLRIRPLHTRGTHRSIDRHRIHRYPAAQTPARFLIDADWSPPSPRMDMRAVDTCTGISYTSEWECYRDRSNTLSRPHRGCPRRLSDQISAP